MEQEALYTIGQVSKICDVSQRMLRYYEKVGLITPDHIAKPSHYRYYSVRTMQRVHKTHSWDSSEADAKQRAKQVSLVKRVIDAYYPEAIQSPKGSIR